ncbi:FAD-dependent oxidoreductase [Geomicrobium sp. JSM 1781026]|uniref:FAD-dependent oxidoreductase n=1 Tax=Geomicrobium sp. JSM 1781026 TaxID=3344580 RepID=UPI0035C0DBEF
MSLWEEDYNIPSFPAVPADDSADVIIVGGGITGITAAYLLTKANVSVILIDADRLVNGTTGHTTAKITAQHGLIYDELIQHTDKTKARLHYEGATDALNMIKETIESLAIDCDFVDKNAVLYAENDVYARKLEREAMAYKTLNIPHETIEGPPDLQAVGGLRMPDQAEFHPIKYLSSLVHYITKHGGRIYEQTVATNLSKDDRPEVITRDGHRLQGSHVIVCSHFPFYEGNQFYFTRMYAERSYILAIKPKQMPAEDDMYLNPEDPVRSIRKMSFRGEELLLIGGEQHKTGQGRATSSHYEALETFANKHFGIERIVDRWSAQDLTTIDKLPYIGRMSDAHPNVYVSTGYRKWGMTTGTLAAMILSDAVHLKQNRYASLYSPNRFYANPSIATFLRENLNVSKHLLLGKLDLTNQSLDDLNTNEAIVFKHNGQRKGAFKDTENHIHIVDTTCTHLGCEVAWNDGDHTWDCPCHGSRFSYTGDVIEGPAETPLQTHDHSLFTNLDTKDDSSGW